MSFRELRLADISKMRTGKLNSNAAVADGEYPFFTCAQQTHRINTFAFDTDAVLLAGNNANGVYPLKYYSGKFNAYQRTYIFESIDKNVLNIRFLYYAMLLCLKRFQSASIGAATQYLTKSLLDDFTIGVPAIESQNKIVEILSDYDEFIINNERRIALLDEATRHLYKEWFSYFRFPGHEHVKIVDGMPEGWQRCALRDIAIIRKGKNITRDTVFEGNIPVVAGGLSPAYFHNVPNVTDAAVTISASGANAGYVNYYQTDIWASDCSYLGTSENERLRYLYLLLKNRQTDITGMQKGSAQPHVYPKDLERLEVFRVPNGLLAQFSDSVDSMFDQVANLGKQNQQLAKARDLLLPRLMSGSLAA